MPEFTEFCSPSYRLETSHDASSRMTNLFPETIERGPRAGKLRLVSTPGLSTVVTLPDQPVRALYAVDGGNRAFAVAGTGVFEIFRDGTYKQYSGSVALNSHPALMKSNGFQIGISSAGRFYLAEGIAGSGGTVTPVTFTDGSELKLATHDFLDNYFIGNLIDSKSVVISKLAPDGSLWDAADIKVKEGHPDNVCRVFADNQQLWVLGFESTEVWVNTGALFPFERMNNAVISIGCSDPYSVAGIAGYRFWRWGDTVYGAYGINPERISDYGVEQALRSYGNTQDAEGWCYTAGGHIFYALSIPAVGRTWVFDLKEKCWHERGCWNTRTGQYDVFRGRVYARAFGLDLVGDPLSGSVYAMSSSVYTDAGGAPLRRLRACPYITENQKNVRYNQLTLDVDTGVGLQVAEDAVGYDPQLVMRYSDNRGKTWANERQSSLGKAGEHNTRVIYNQLGSSRIGKVFELSCTEPVPLSFMGAYLKLGAPEAGR